jgi:hypothetical protein
LPVPKVVTEMRSARPRRWRRRPGSRSDPPDRRPRCSWPRSGGVGGRAVHLGRILAGEGAAAVTGHAAVGVDDDLATGQAAVAHRAADDELAGRVDVELGVLVSHFGRQHRLDDQLAHRFDQVLWLMSGLCWVDSTTASTPRILPFVVAQGDLALGVRTQPRQQCRSCAPRPGARPAGGVGDRRRHQHVGFVAGVAEHQALVAGALLFRVRRSTPWLMSGTACRWRSARRRWRRRSPRRSGCNRCRASPRARSASRSTQALVVTSPATITTPVLTRFRRRRAQRCPAAGWRPARHRRSGRRSCPDGLRRRIRR